MYLTEIMLYLTWPALILISFWLVKLAFRKFEKRWKEE
jgi:hypothetical protein